MGLLWTSLITYGICVWTTVHKDIVPKCNGWHRFVYKFWWVAFAFCGPEPLLFVAINQFLEAREIQKTWASLFPDELGLEGAFFLLMGGYTLQRMGEAKRGGEEERDGEEKRGGGVKRSGEAKRETDFMVTLTHEGFKKLLEKLAEYQEEKIEIEDKFEDEKETNFIKKTFWRLVFLIGLRKKKATTKRTKNLHLLESRLSFNPFDKKEASDKGNANNVSKAIALCQTLWFITQCLIRIRYGLPLTLVEVHVSIQIIFAALMTIFWWKKPFNVNNPVVITLDGELWDYILNFPKQNGEQGQREADVPVPNETPSDQREKEAGHIQVVPVPKETSSDQREKKADPIQVVPVPKKTSSDQREKTVPVPKETPSDRIFISPNDKSRDFRPTEDFGRTEYSLSTEYSKDMLVVIEPTRLTEYKLLYHAWHSVMSQLGRGPENKKECQGANKSVCDTDKDEESPLVRNRYPMQ